AQPRQTARASRPRRTAAGRPCAVQEQVVYQPDVPADSLCAKRCEAGRNLPRPGETAAEKTTQVLPRLPRRHPGAGMRASTTVLLWISAPLAIRSVPPTATRLSGS